MKCKNNLWLYVKCGSVSNVVAQENPHIAKFESLLFTSRPKHLGRLFIFSNNQTSFFKQILTTLSAKDIIFHIVTMLGVMSQAKLKAANTPLAKQTFTQQTTN